MTWRRSLAIAALTLTVALASVGSAVAARTAKPGNPEAGRALFKKFCARCHNFMATGTQATAKGGVTGSDLDVLKPRYSRVVTAMVQGEGGLPAEYFLLRMTFQEIYDVAAFVAKYAGKPAPAKHVTAAAGSKS